MTQEIGAPADTATQTRRPSISVSLFWEIGAPQTADRSRRRPLSIVIPISHPRSNTCRLRRQVLVGGKLGQQAPQTLESCMVSSMRWSQGSPAAPSSPADGSLQQRRDVLTHGSDAGQIGSPHGVLVARGHRRRCHRWMDGNIAVVNAEDYVMKVHPNQFCSVSTHILLLIFLQSLS